MNDIEAYTPGEALKLYLESRQDDLTETTLQSHRYRLEPFASWCNDQGIEDIGDVNGKHLYEYRRWRKLDGGLSTVSLHTQLSTLRVFLKFCEKVGIVDDGLQDAVDIPSIQEGEDRRERRLEEDHADDILTYLDTYHYASFDHVMMMLFWKTGMRIGALHSLDVGDCRLDKGQLVIEHRPQGGTTLKMGNSGERVVAINAQTCEVLEDWIESKRHPVTDENGRKPLMTTSQGRATKSTIRRHVYKVTQPCQIDGICPHGRDMDECEDIGYTSSNGCPSSVSPHDIRRGAITYWLSDDIPKKAVGDRANVHSDVLDEHYDTRSNETKAEQRRKFFRE